ncbi:undecaprenyl-phosphate glucose phosphotransferase [Glaciimonas immobilis]|uniref:Putative colanic acid biosynthesis UDP-glucose lipid carrier transferase n=1 Tax=Glaciimonas immobilis TaxID=728004 RepID=A0A840RR98_9BURK|nr:undecaprenyl-phosphate glucose phosphotransferase [Glaciimonas immobilis]KAF3998169.1 undecaprenyl-phosphate glucose phosphotransferase [Glaciimonas immobilis]MBB5199121.1 putative colanic acid biosynthesis UDP-glucose lipid carrier transferase [Glaciimonas immobilis]
MPTSSGLIFKQAFELELLRRLIDVVVLAGAALLANYLRYGSAFGPIPPVHLVLLYLSCAMVLFGFPQKGISTRGRLMPQMFVRFATSWAMILLAGLLLTFFVHRASELSRLWLLYWYVTGFVFLSLYKIFTHGVLSIIRRRGLNSKRIMIVGYGRTGQEMHKRALQHHGYGYDVTAIYADPADQASIDLDANSPTCIKSLDAINDYLQENDIHEIWITLPISASAQLLELQYLLRNALVDVRWVPDMLGFQMVNHQMVDFLGLATVELNRPVSHGMRGVIKHLFDKVFATVVLTLLLPVFAVIAVGIKCSSSGPIFFKQARLGFNGKKFMVYKFRSMTMHKETGELCQATQNDVRITPFGQFLRRTSLDELPQFINVLLGDMSVVGPRPHALQHNVKYEEILELYMARHRVRPGITGWAQIHGLRGETDTLDKMEKRVEFDMHYIHNWSLLMDLRIVIWTAFKGWTGSNAY